jgi:hypothetical protein
MSYVIEKGIPIPQKPKRGRVVGQLSDTTIAVGALQPGESLVCTAKSEDAIKSRVNYYSHGKGSPWYAEKRRFTYAPAFLGSVNSFRVWRTA